MARAARLAHDNDDCDTKVRSASRRVAANLVIRVDTSTRLTSTGALTPAPISDSGDQARAPPQAHASSESDGDESPSVW